MMEASEINKIYVKSPIEIENVNMSTLLFSNHKALSKNKYNISDSYLNLVEPSLGNLVLYQNVRGVNYFEYEVELSTNNVVIDGNRKDLFGNRIIGLEDTVVIFVNGLKLDDYEYSIDAANNTITINHIDKRRRFSSVIICTSEELAYKGKVTDAPGWNQNTKTLTVEDYNTSRYIFFKNGELVENDELNIDGSDITFTIVIRPGVDVVEYYRLPSDVVRYDFDLIEGVLTYGPEDKAGNPLPELYDCVVTFNDVTRYLIDNLRKGFMIREEKSDGCLLVIDTTYETKELHCITVHEFISNKKKENQYFIQVPEARSILHYVSNYDLKGVLFPELLSVFQFILLNETYDSLQRLREIRSTDKVDSGNINQLINLLGLKINITNMTLKQRHNLLEELNNYYNLVGTKSAFNFYNATTNTGNIVNVDQLFTPIRDGVDNNSLNKRYVTFKTAEELGAVYKQEYEIPYIDYGDVTALANSGETLSNRPRSEGVLQNPDELPNFEPFRRVHIIGESGDTEVRDLPVALNLYIEKPVMGPNTPTVDYGWVNSFAMYADLSGGNTVLLGEDLYGHLLDGLIDTDTTIWVKKDDETEEVNNGGTVDISGETIKICTPVGLEYYKRLDKSEYIIETQKRLVIKPRFGATGKKTEVIINTKSPVYDNILDYGNVADPIKGRWIEWFEWDRNPDWYPTNHVEVLTEIPTDIPYETFSKYFSETFYNIASTVVYIHALVNTYMFGKNNSNFVQTDKERSDIEYTLLAGPLYNEQEHYIGNDPARQPLPYLYKHPVSYEVKNKSLVMNGNVLTATVEVDVSYNDFTAEVREKTIETFTHDFVCDWNATNSWTARELTFDQNTSSLQETSSFEDHIIDGEWSCYMCEKNYNSNVELLGNSIVLGSADDIVHNGLRVCLPFKEIRFTKPEYNLDVTFDDLGFTGEFNELWSYRNIRNTVDPIEDDDSRGYYKSQHEFTCGSFGSLIMTINGTITSGWINIRLNPTPSDAHVVLEAQAPFTPHVMKPNGNIHGQLLVEGDGYQVIEVPHGLPVKWTVSKNKYYTMEGVIASEESIIIGKKIPLSVVFESGTAGQTSLNITCGGRYELTICGAGGGAGGGAGKHGSWVSGAGGSGSAYKGIINLTPGTYQLTVGAKGTGGIPSGRNAGNGTNGENSQIYKGSTKLIVTGGGGGGGGCGKHGHSNPGVGGKLSIGSMSIVSTEIKSNGVNGSTASVLHNAYGKGGASVQGGNPGGKGTNGYIKLELKQII